MLWKLAVFLFIFKPPNVLMNLITFCACLLFSCSTFLSFSSQFSNSHCVQVFKFHAVCIPLSVLIQQIRLIRSSADGLKTQCWNELSKKNVWPLTVLNSTS